MYIFNFIMKLISKMVVPFVVSFYQCNEGFYFFYILPNTWNWQTFIFSNLVVGCFNLNSWFSEMLTIFLWFLSLQAFSCKLPTSSFTHFSIGLVLFLIFRNLHYIMPENSLIYMIQISSPGLWLVPLLFL